MENTLQGPQKSKQHHHMTQLFHSQAYTQIVHTPLQKYLYPLLIVAMLMYSSKETEKTDLSINRCIADRNVVCTGKKLLLNCKAKQNEIICRKMYRLGKYIN